MSDANVIREYLVALGFKVDDKSLKSFEKGVEDSGKAVFKMAAAVELAAVGIAIGVAKFAANMDQLYFASKRNETSVRSIKAVEFAARNLGASAEEARGSIEGLSAFMRENPGAEDFIASLGVDAKDGNGKLKEKSQLLAELGQKLSKMPWFQAKQYGNALGISDNMLRAIQSGQFSSFMDQFNKSTKDTDFDAAAEKARKLDEKIFDLVERFKAIAITVGEKIMPVFEKLIDKFETLDKDTDGMSTKIIGLTAVFVALGGPSVVKGIWNLVAAIGAIGGATATAASGGVLGKILAAASRLGAGIGLMTYSSGLNEGEDEWADQQRQKRAKRTPYDILRGFGWSHEQAAGILANLKAESGMDPSAVGDGGKAYGIAQWHPDRQANFAKWSGKDIRQSTLDEQMAFMNYELTQGAEQKAGRLLKATSNARAAGEVMSRYYERPLAADAEAAKRGAAAVQIAQQTTIHVNGGDAGATGRAVAGEQARVNSDMARNMQTAIN